MPLAPGGHLSFDPTPPRPPPPFSALFHVSFGMRSETSVFSHSVGSLVYLAVFSATSCGVGEAVIEFTDDQPDTVAAFDAGVALDAGGGRDASVAFDAGTPVDAGSPFDAGAGPERDAGAELDAGVVADAGADAGNTSSSFDAGAPDAGPVARQVVVCLTGAVDQSSPSNAGFTQLCDQLGASVTLVRSCRGSACASSFATFPATSAGATVTDATFAALDLNQDQRVNAADGPTTLTILGFSWGGVNAGDLAERLSSDGRIAHAQLRMRLVILDAYQPFVSGVSPAANVDEAWSFRHTVTPHRIVRAARRWVPTVACGCAALLAGRASTTTSRLHPTRRSEHCRAASSGTARCRRPLRPS